MTGTPTSLPATIVRALVLIIALGEAVVCAYFVAEALQPQRESITQSIAAFIAIIVSIPFWLMTAPAVVLAIRRKLLWLALILVIGAVPVAFALLKSVN